jgi:solute carrier family 50 protein (sugar transporter)
MVDCGDNDNTCVILTTYVAPALGVLIGNILWLSSFPATMNAFSKLQLGSLNPIPFPFMLMNSFMWLVYSVLKGDHFIYFANIFGFILSLFYSFICVVSAMFEYQESSDARLTKIINKIKLLLFIVALIIVASFDILLITSIDMKTKVNICGIMAVIFLAFFYASPLSLIFGILKNKDSSGLDWYLVLASFTNGFLWFIYGLFLNEPYLYAPNGFGIIVSLIQVVCLITFPKRIQLPNDREENASINDGNF